MRSAPRSGLIVRGGFERGGWALPLFENDDEAATFLNEVYSFRVVVFPVITGSTGRDRVHDGYPDVTLEMVASRTFRRQTPAARVRPYGAHRSTRLAPRFLSAHCCPNLATFAWR